MKKKLCILLAVAMLVAIALSGCKEKREIAWTNYGRAEDIPCVAIPGGEYDTAEDFRYSFRKALVPGIDSEWGTLTKVVAGENAPIVNWSCGNGMYLTRYKNATLETYHTLLQDMETAGFAVYAQSSLNDDVHSTVLTYQENAYTVTYFARTGKIDVVASKEMLLSPHLQQENYSTQAEENDGIKTTLRMVSPRSTGSGFVIQLKNGHFVIVDGGNHWDLGKLLTYLDENVPEGQIPVVEAWFVTHSDYDRTGWTTGFTGSENTLKYLQELLEPVLAKERLHVNGIYYNIPGSKVLDGTIYKEQDTIDGTTYYSKSSNNWTVRVEAAASVLKTQDGLQTPIYRPMAGQTFHFSGGLTVEVTWSQEQMLLSEYDLDFKNASSAYVVRAEDKAVLAMGSATKTCQGRIAAVYSSTYWEEVDVLLPAHYGRRLFEEYKDIFKAPIVIYEAKDLASLTGESAAVTAYYTQQPDITVYSFADGTIFYDFATGTITTQ